MRILLTGASGRIGRVLRQGLAADFDCRLTDLGCETDKNVIPADLAVDDLTPLVEGMDGIVHMAGHPNSRDWEVVERANMLASRRLINAAVGAGVGRFIYASSVHVLGMWPAATTISEDLDYRPDGPYGVSKAVVEMMLRHAADRQGMSSVALRIFSFRPQPGNVRELSTWLSPDDTVALVRAALRSDLRGFATVAGISNNSRAAIDKSGWARIGYAPTDNAEVFASQLENSEDAECKRQWRYLGGAFAETS